MSDYLKQISKERFNELVKQKILNLNTRDKMFKITSKKKSGKAKTYYVIDDLAK